MIIVTTPMCEKILEFAGISDYKVNKNPDDEKGDLAILLSESKTKMNSLKIKLNTFSQIKDSIIEVSKLKSNESLNSDTIDNVDNLDNMDNGNNMNNIDDHDNMENDEFTISQKIEDIFAEYPLANQWLNGKKEDLKEKNSKIKVKVYSEFIKDIVKDMGFYIIDSDKDDLDFDFKYLIFPDYMNADINNLYDIDDEDNRNFQLISIPTHNNVSKDPIKRAELRYSILSSLE